MSRNMLMAMFLVVLGYALLFVLLTHEVKVYAKGLLRLLGNSTLSRSCCRMHCICFDVHEFELRLNVSTAEVGHGDSFVINIYTTYADFMAGPQPHLAQPG